MAKAARTKSAYRSVAFAALHETAEDLAAVGAISKQTMREFDEACLSPIEPFAPADIRKLREREGVSQPVFARYLNITKSTVEQWERGEKRPRGTSLKLLSLVKARGLAAIL